MKFIDEAMITARSGNGGRGCVSFRREKFVPRGGPDGGDGGKGGDVVLKAISGKRTLYQFRFQRNFKAKNGSHGQGKQKTGKNGRDVIISLPTGTLITDADTGQLIKDLIKPGERVVVAKGGRGGQGNARFKTSTNRAPRFAQPGEPGEIRKLKLELKLLADVGIIGLPNAGKSTLITALSSARPKIGAYPFTTTIPSLGMVYGDFHEPFIIADIPGLIEGAHKGTGLGIQFLRHIERNSMLLFLIPADADDIEKEYNILLRELEKYNPELLDKQRILAVSKSDMLDDELKAEIEPTLPKGIPSLFISSVAQQNLDKLKDLIWLGLNP